MLKTLAISLLITAASLFAADAKKPNVLIIVADDLGYGELGCQGNPQIPTPRVDSLAKNGTRFTSGYVSGPYCSPTRAAMLTGRYQQRFGHEFNPGPAAPAGFGLSLEETALPQRFKEVGYATGMFGKWHLGNDAAHHPMKRGFDEYFGFLGGSHSYLRYGNGVLRGTTPVDGSFTTEDFAKETVAFIEKHKAEPWFVYLPFNAVHAPLEVPEKYRERVKNVSPEKRQTFAAMLCAMDDAIGTVLEKLRTEKMEENTLIFFISDNGGPTPQTTSGNGPLSGFKAQIMEGGVRVPFIIQWKGALPAGKVDDRPVIQIDIAPTALAAAGVEVKTEWKFEGVNLLPFLKGEKTEPPHTALYWRFGRQRALRMGDWKLNDMGQGARLYNLTSDVGEKNDLAAEKPEKLKELEAAWAEWNKQNIAPKWGGGGGRRNFDPAQPDNHPRKNPRRPPQKA